MIDDRTGIVDVRAITAEGSHINIEVQRKDYGNMDTRSLYYWSKLLNKAIKKGEDYIELPKIIAINILDFNFFPIPIFHTTYKLRESTYKDFILTDIMELHYIEMPKFRSLKDKDMNNPLHRWLAFFNKKLSDNELKELINMDTAIKQAVDKIEYLASDEDAVRRYQQREMALYDYMCGIQKAKREGKEEGIQKGKKESHIEVAKNALKEGLPIEIITKITELDIENIKKLQAELDIE